MSLSDLVAPRSFTASAPLKGAVIVFLAVLSVAMFRTAAFEQAKLSVYANSFEARFTAELDRRSAILDGFAAHATRSRSDLPMVRELAHDLADVVNGWFVLVEPGPDVRIAMATLGDGSVPPPIPRDDPRYKAQLKAEKLAAATKSVALTDTFLGLKSKLPSTSIVREVHFADGLRFVFLSHATDSFHHLLQTDLPPATGVELLDSSGALVHSAQEDAQSAALHVSSPLSALFAASVRRELPFGWTVTAHKHWLTPAAMVVPLLFASGIAALVFLMLRCTMREPPARPDESLRDRLSFVLTLGHELRSPLISLLSAIDAVKRGSDNGSEAFLDHATREAHGLLRLIDDVLDCAKVSQSDIVVHDEPYGTKDLLTACVETVQPTVRPGVAVDLSIDGPALTLIGDRPKIRQILLNFLTNAAKFTLQGSIALRLTVRPTGPDTVETLFIVSDTGEGMAPETQAHLFREAGVFEGRSDRNAKGNGLGLVTARLLAEAMGGTVGAQSVAGIGSTFWLRLPQRVAPDTPQAATRSTESLSALRIAVAEDDPIVGRVIADDLTACGADVTLLPDGQALVDACTAAPFDIVLTDLRMPRLSGHDAAAALRAALPSPPPIFAISAHYAASPFGPDDDGLFDGVLPKPFSVKALLDLLDGSAAQADDDDHDRGQMDTLLRAYGARAPALASDICDSLTQGCRDLHSATGLAEIGSISHRMSGVALTIGLTSLGLGLLDLERLCEGGDRSEVDAALHRLEPAIARACAVLHQAAREVARVAAD